MNDGADSLPLRDIHLPETVSWWPLAPGWWILLFALFLAVIAGFLLYRYFRRRRRSPLRHAHAALDDIRAHYADEPDESRLIRELSALLRRTAISVYDRHDVASLTGIAWLQFLDTPMQDKPFSEGRGQVLSTGPYQSRADIESEDLLQLCQDWLNAVEAQS